jgi:hypothetical protein
MGCNLFISYAHKDEQFKDQLEEHLAQLRRNGVISDWNDRKIAAGQDWAQEIDQNLLSADIIVFLISASFLASEYCIGKEVKQATKMHQQGKAMLIPVLVRSCAWCDNELSKFQALPKDAIPISKWDDIDDGWLNVVTGLKSHIETFKPTNCPSEVEPSITGIEISEEHQRWLEDTEIVLTHRKVDKVNLSDIYVSPDLEDLDPDKHKDIEYFSSDEILKEPSHSLIVGEEQQGKTTLLKYLFKEFAKTGFIPLYLNGEKVSRSDLKININAAIEEQYIGLDFKTFIAHPNRVILIDNIDDIGLNNKYQNVFLKQLTDTFGWIIATCHSSFSYVASDLPELADFKESELLGLGNLKREELAKKWISLGIEESICDSELYSKCDEMKAHLNTVIKKNIVPPKPIYVLMLMQMFEAYAQQNLELTSFGHCYQQLIYQSFENAGIKGKEYEKYINVLTELSWRIFKNESPLNQSKLEVFFKDYEADFLAVDREKVLKKLIDHSILVNNRGSVGFKYPYIYYFFVGKKIAESYREEDDVKSSVVVLLNNLHREDFANILIFITHHTKDSWVITEIKKVLASLFKDQAVAKLYKPDLSFIGDFIKSIPELVIEQREIKEERELHNRRLDEIDRDLENAEVEEGEEPHEILSNINKTFKGMEIAGQIIRNRHSSMKKSALYDLAQSGTNAGLRFLDHFIRITDSARNDILRFIEIQLREHPNITDQQIQIHAQNLYLHTSYGVINGVVRKIASSIGSREAREIYSAIEKDSSTPAMSLIKQSIELQFSSELNVNNIEATAHTLRDNPVCFRILKEMVIQHIYMHPVKYDDKQKLASKLGISVQGQRLMDLKTRAKA